MDAAQPLCPSTGRAVQPHGQEDANAVDGVDVGRPQRRGERWIGAGGHDVLWVDRRDMPAAAVPRVSEEAANLGLDDSGRTGADRDAEYIDIDRSAGRSVIRSRAIRHLTILPTGRHPRI